MAQATGVRKIGASELQAFCRDGDRTLYVIDVRTEEEFLRGHLQCAVWVPGGQLLQTLDEHVATTNSRIVVVDSEGVRALVIASWLTQMGWAQAWALSLDDEPVELISGPAAGDTVGYAGLAPTTTPAELQEGLKRGDVVVIDVDTSTTYEAGHIPGAWFAIRSRLASLAPALSKAREVVVTSGDGALAQLAAVDLASKVPVPVRALEGGTRAWQAEGHALTVEPMWAHVPEDEWRPPQTDQEVREYFQWELDLVEQIRRDGNARYQIAKIDRTVST
jgi:rhodanese-related sulfurtransferase